MKGGESEGEHHEHAQMAAHSANGDRSAVTVRCSAVQCDCNDSSADVRCTEGVALIPFLLRGLPHLSLPPFPPLASFSPRFPS